jgi:hypothetical protein
MLLANQMKGNRFPGIYAGKPQGQIYFLHHSTAQFGGNELFNGIHIPARFFQVAGSRRWCNTA